MAPDRIVAFYAGGVDDRQRTLDAILAQGDDWLEAVHDYIQWMFPTRTPSSVNLSAPLVTAETIAAFRASPDLRDKLRSALDRMLAFYGLHRSSTAAGTVVITTDPARFPQRAGAWLRPFNHNHLRLTRIMQSLAALGLTAEAEALQRCLLSDVAAGPGAGRITADTLEYWARALS